MKSLFEREAWSTAEALAAIALAHGFTSASDLYDDDIVGTPEVALLRMTEGASAANTSEGQRAVNWANAAKALSPLNWLELRLHPMLWVRWVMSSAEVNRPEPFCTEFGNWYTQKLAGGLLPVMRRYSTSRNRWHGQNLTTVGFQRGHGDPVHAFILKEMRTGDLESRWQMHLVPLPILILAESTEIPNDAHSTVQSRQSRGKGVEAALTLALNRYCRTKEAKVKKVSRPKPDELPFQARDIGREELIDLLCRRYSTLRDDYKLSTMRTAMSGLTSCRPGRAPRVRRS